MADHTSGPWAYSRMGTVGDFRVTGPTFLSGEADIVRTTGIAFNIYHEANAQIIAAAPDLLSALQALVAYVEAADNPIDQGANYSDDTVTDALAAIRKAKGRS